MFFLKILTLLFYFFLIPCFSGTEKNKSFNNIHPRAIYYLTGGDYNVSDIRNAIVGINTSKFKLKNYSKERYGVELYIRNHKKQRFIGYIKKNGDLNFEDFAYRVYRKLAKSNNFVVYCAYNGGGSHTFIDHLFITRHRKNYYDRGKIKIIDILTCEGDFGHEKPSNQKIKIVEKFSKRKPKQEEIKSSDEEFKDMHPYAFYYLSGADYRLDDTEKGIISINASKFKFDVKSNEVCGKVVYKKGNKIGFRYDANSLEKEKEYLQKDDFYIVVYKKLSNLNYYIVKCVFTRGNNTPQIDYLLIRKHYKYYYYWDKFEVMEILTCDGNLGYKAPSKKEIKKVEKLISQRLIGDIS